MGPSEPVGPPPPPPGFQLVGARPQAPPPPPPGFELQGAATPAIPPPPTRASEAMPSPDQVDHQTTANARAFAELATRPAIPGLRGGELPLGYRPPPLPAGMDPNWTAPSTYVNPRTGKRGTNMAPGRGGGPLSVLDSPITGGTQMLDGAAQTSTGKASDIAGGASKIIRGGLEAATPLMVGAGVTAPVVTGLTLATGMGLQGASEKLLKAAGVPAEYAALGSDLISIFGAGAAFSKLRTLSKLPHVTESNAIAGKLRTALDRAKDPKLTSGERAAARAQADALLGGLRSAEAGQPSTSGLGTAAAAGRPGVPHGGAHEEGNQGTGQQAGQQQAVAPGGAGGSVAQGTGGATSRPLLGSGATLPRHLSGAKPRYAFGSKQFELEFADDVDRAAYITAQHARSKRDADYLRFAMDATGLSEAEVRGHGAEVRQRIKKLAKGSEPGKLSVPAIPKPRGRMTTEVPSGQQPAAAQQVDTGATRPVDAGGTGGGGAVHEQGAPIARPGAGEETDILVPGEDRSLRARYDLRELAEVRSSHNGQTFQPNPEYTLHNERDYSKPENQGRVIEQSNEERFDPRYHITDNPDATNGPTVIDERGNALGGNSRAMHLQRVYGRDGRGAAAYRALLEKKAAQFGIDPAAVRGMKQPVLVRVVPDAELATLPGGSKWAIRKTNISGVAQLSASERAAADAGQLSEPMVEHIAGAIEQAGQDATLNDALMGKSGTSIVNHLIDDGFFSEQERPALMDGKTGALTQVAKDRISKALLGQFFRDSDQIARTPASIRGKLERLAAPLSKVRGNPEWDLTPAIREAIDLVEYAKAHGIDSVKDVVAQEAMFEGDKPEWSSEAVTLAEWLRDRKPNELVTAVRKYVGDREPTMFGERTPAEAFEEHFGGEKTEGAAEPPAGTPESGPHGPIFRQFHRKPEEAIAWLVKHETGEAVGALHHPAVGDIDLVWGKPGHPWHADDDGFGLAHIIAKHGKEFDVGKLQEMLNDMRPAEVQKQADRMELESEKYHATVRLSWDKQSKTWLLTSFDHTVPPSAKGRSFVPGDPISAGETSPSPEEGGRGSLSSETPDSGAPDSSVPVPEDKDGPLTTFWKDEEGTSYVGAILKADVEEVRALKAKRDAALEALEQAAATPGEKKFGQKVIEYFTGERDMWSARVNQVIAHLRKLVPDPVEQEALSLMRDFKHKPQELAQFLDGSHPALQNLDSKAPLTRGLPGSEYAMAMDRIRELRPVILRALDPTPRMLKADALLTKIAEATLNMGRDVGILESRWQPDEYVPHILNRKGAGELPKLPGDLGRAIGGKMSRYFSFAEKRELPSLLEAVANGYKPKTLNAFDAFTIHGDQFATARATHLLTQQLGEKGLGQWGVRDRAPEGWVPLADHSTEFRNLVGYEDEHGLPAAAEQRLFVPEYIADALKPITDPDYTGRLPLFRAMRATQHYQKTIQLGLSFFHAYTENLMSLANSGPRGWVKALRADRDSAEFLLAERDMIAHGGTSAIQGHTYEAWKALQPGSIPTWGEIWRRSPGIHQMDMVAGKITDFTFGNLQRRFKVTDYQLHLAGWLAKHPNATAGELRAAKVSMAKEINAVYGGLNFENLGWSRATTEVVRALMLAPDWTFSNIFNLKYATERGTPAGKMARMFWIRTIAGGMVATQAMSLMMSRQLSQNPTQVYYGKDKEGNDIYQNMFFKGASGDVIGLIHNVGDYGAVVGTVRSMAGKAAPIPRAGFQLIFNRDYLGREIAPKGMNPIASTLRGAGKTIEAVLPIPFTISNMYDMLLGPDAGKYSVPEFLSTSFSGNPPRHVAPEGTRRTKQGLRPLNQKPAHSLWEEITTGKR